MYLNSTETSVESSLGVTRLWVTHFCITSTRFTNQTTNGFIYDGNRWGRYAYTGEATKDPSLIW